MTNVEAPVTRKAMSIEATVIRCGCGNPASHPNSVCPKPRATEKLGVIQYWHMNPLRMLVWYLYKYIGRYIGFSFAPVGANNGSSRSE